MNAPIRNLILAALMAALPAAPASANGAVVAALMMREKRAERELIQSAMEAACRGEAGFEAGGTHEKALTPLGVSTVLVTPRHGPARLRFMDESRKPFLDARKFEEIRPESCEAQACGEMCVEVPYGVAPK